MSKAEKFIQEHTRKLTQYGDDYFLWITPDQARKAVEIAREEMVEKVTNYLNSKLYDWVQISHFGRREYPDTIMKQDFIEDFKKYVEE